VRELLERRRPIYAAVASVVVVTTGRCAEEVAAEVLRTMRWREERDERHR